MTLPVSVRLADRRCVTCERGAAATQALPKPSGPKPLPQRIQIPRYGVIPKRGYVTQRSGAAPRPKSNFAALSGKGHEAIFEFHASPLPGGFTTAAYLSGPAPADAR